MVLIIVFAPFGLPTPYCGGPAHLATDSLFAAITDLSEPAEKGHHETETETET